MKATINAGTKILGGILVAICALVLSMPARAQVTVNSKVIDFGTRTVGSEAATVSVRLTNTTSRYTRLDSAWIWGSGFSYSGPSGSFTFRPSQTLTVPVSFRPGSAQSFTGAVTFLLSNGQRISVSLSGKGISSATQTTRRGRRDRQSSNGGSTNNTPDPVTPAPVVAPAITTQPVNRTVTAGQTASFSITASGDSLSYQWKKNGAAISGATSPSYNTPVTGTPDSGTQFTCTVSNSAGSVTSNPATLTVNAATIAPSITSQPGNRTVIAGQTASFSVSVSGTAPFTYQWTRNGAAIAGAVSSTYTTPAATSADNGAQFAVIVTNAAGNVTSSPATLTVSAATLLLTSNPSSLTFGNVDLGGSATKQITLTNSGNGNVALSGLSINGAGFSASGISSGQILTPGQKATITVSFKPVTAGSVNGQVTVTSSAAPVVVNLSGSGVQQITRAVALSWTRSTSTVAGYFVYSSQVSGGPYTKLTATTVSLPSFTDSSVQNGKTYYYVVTAVDASGLESNYSNQASALIQ
jgi:hypothetical protein